MPAGNNENCDGSGRKIAILGPVLPFRGGIAQHTTLLIRALSKNCECQVFSFTYLFPKWLYPGESDRDPNYEGYVESNTQYVLNTLNPLTWFQTAARIISGEPDFVLIPWWTFFLGPMSTCLAWLFRRQGIEVVFFCHNVMDHEQASWKRWMTRLALRRGTRFVVHTQTEARQLKKFVAKSSILIHPHPIYDQFPEAEPLLARRAKIELLFYGFVRPYKGLDILIEAMRELKDVDTFLTVAGEFWGDEEEHRKNIEDSSLADRIEIISRYVSDKETAELFGRADVVVLPYRSATGSGVIPIAYNYRKPVVATRVGGLPDVVIDGKTGWLSDVDPASLAKTIRNIDPAKLPSMKRNIDRVAERLSWDSLAATVTLNSTFHFGITETAKVSSR